MASLLCCAACETASCACQLGKCFCKDGKMSVTTANIVYLILFAVWTFIAFALQEWGAPQFDFYSFNIGCKDIPGIDVSACKGENAVYRISLAMMLWFVIIMLGNLCSKRFHTGFWGPKILALLVLTSGLFFTPIVGQDGYVQFARVISAVFLVSQLIYFIDAAYSWNSYFADKAYGDLYDENRNWVALALMTCFFLMLGVAVANILLYIYYDHCTRQAVFITVTLLLIIIATVSQLNIQDTDSSLVTSCIVSAYATYLCWSSVSADECNPDQTRTQEQTIFAFCVTAISLIWSSYSAGTRKTTQPTNIIQLTTEDDDDDDDDDDEPTDSISVYMFHASMATGSVYMSMLLTNWGTVAGKQSAAQMWVSIISQWISMLLYGWTLIAPKCCPDREFSQDF
jgi:serine incorporator 1/3